MALNSYNIGFDIDTGALTMAKKNLTEFEVACDLIQVPTHAYGRVINCTILTMSSSIGMIWQSCGWIGGYSIIIT
jgi:hypothetical protein